MTESAKFELKTYDRNDQDSGMKGANPSSIYPTLSGNELADILGSMTRMGNVVGHKEQLVYVSFTTR